MQGVTICSWRDWRSKPQTLLCRSTAAPWDSSRWLPIRQTSSGLHLQNKENTEYNVSFVQHLAAEQDVLLVNLAVRQYGLLVAPGNPKQIRTLAILNTVCV